MAKLLIIEDDPSSSRFLKKIATRLGHEVICTENGKEGLAQVEQICPDLILSDLHMPGAPAGMDLIHTLRKKYPDINIIIISGFPSEEILQECRRIGVEDFLTKPFEVGFVGEVIDKLLGEKPGDQMEFS